MGYFDVRFQDVQDLQNALAQFGQSVSGAADDADAKVRGLMALDTFKGSGAEGIKGYFGDVHLTLIKALDVLVKQLASEYAAEYCARFYEAPVAECSNDAHWVSEVMESVTPAMKGVCNQAETVENLLREARSAMPASVHLDYPTIDEVVEGAEDTRRSVTEVRAAVDDIESRGARRAADGKFNELASALERLFSSYGSSSSADGGSGMAGFTRSAFLASGPAQGLMRAIADCEQYQQQHADTLQSAQNACIAAQQQRLAEQRRMIERDAAKWLAVGSSAAVATQMGTALAMTNPFRSGGTVGGLFDRGAGFLRSGNTKFGSDAGDAVESARKFLERTDGSYEASAALGRAGSTTSATAEARIRSANKRIDGLQRRYDELEALKPKEA